MSSLENSVADLDSDRICSTNTRGTCSRGECRGREESLPTKGRFTVRVVEPRTV